MFAEKVNATTVFSMGNGEGAAAEVDEEWPGPGTAYHAGGMTDVNQRDFYRQWYEVMAQGE